MINKGDYKGDADFLIAHLPELVPVHLYIGKTWTYQS